MTNPTLHTPDQAVADLNIPLGDPRDLQWTQMLPMLIATLENGTPMATRLAKRQLHQMAAVADVAAMAMSVLMSASSRGLVLDGDLQSKLKALNAALDDFESEMSTLQPVQEHKHV